MLVPISCCILAVMSNQRRHVSIPRPPPRDAQQRAVEREPVSPDYTSRVSPPRQFIGQDMPPSPSPPRPQLPPRQQAMSMTPPTRPRIQSVSPTSSSEPRFLRATSYRESLSPTFRQRSNSNLDSLGMPHTNRSVTSFASSYADDDHYGPRSPEVCSISSQLSISLIHL